MIFPLFSRPSTRPSHGSRASCPARCAGAGLVALSLALGPARAGGQVVKDTVHVTNRATVQYVGGDGAVGGMTAEALVVVRQLAGVTLELASDTVVAAGTRVGLPHVVTNRGTAADAFSLQATGASGWTAAAYVDVDGDGALGPGDTLATAAFYLARDASARVLLVVDVPAGAAGGSGILASLRAVSTIDPTVVATATDRVAVLRPAVPDVAIAKSVDRAAATTGDTLLYTIVVRNRGGAATPTAAVVGDTLPAGLAYVPGSLRLDGVALSDASDADAGAVAGSVASFALGALAPATTRTATLRARVVAAAGAGAVANVASVSYGDTAIASPAATTAFSFADLALAKDLVGGDSAIVGKTVTWRLSWQNRSNATAARDVLLTDTLPPSTQFVSADGNPAVSGQVVTWTIGTVAPGATGSYSLVARLVAEPPAGARVVNTATLQGSNAAAVGAAAAGLRVVQFAGTELAITKQSGAFEASVGDAVPYSITVRNTGWADISGIVVRDELPDGMRLATSSVVGADSVRLSGQTATFYWRGPLAPAATHAIGYTTILASAGKRTTIANRAVAMAEGGLLRSSTATATIRVRSGHAMQTRTLIGKVWVDRNDDGRQQAGELGVGGIQIVSADGQAVVTDAEGRFSFRDLRAGTHALRLDTLGLPRGVHLARASEELVLVQHDGWTTPQVNFRLVTTDTLACADVAPAASGSAAAAGSAVALQSIVAMPARAAEPSPMVAELASATGPAIAPLRTADERTVEEGRAFITGPTVRLMSPADGAVVATDRIYVGVRGEAGMAVRVYDGEARIAEGTLRPDGVQDFVGVPLTPGTHRLRVWMKNSFGQERWDSVVVHRSGRPARLDVDTSARSLRIEAAAPEVVRVRVLDQWGVPVAGSDPLTVIAEDAAVDGVDADPSSTGEQRAVRPDGTVDLAVRAGRQVGMGGVSLSVGAAKARLPLSVLPSARALTAVGVGQLGVGAAGQSFGALSVRGAVGKETAVSVSYDSRRGRGDDFFGRGYDPLDDARYPTFGDGSERRVTSGSSERLSVRVERGFDWLELGDVRTDAFAAGDRLGSYQRSLSGLSGRYGAGRVVLDGFASVTQQALKQVQLRGDGGSGPYVLGAGIRRGTDRVALEVRERDNAARVIAREELVRYADYEIDYTTGAVVLRRPVPSVDPYGNPMYVVATVERRDAGAMRLVGGLRAESDLARWVRLPGLDSLAVGVSGVHTGSDGAGATGGELVGADVRVARSGASASAELLRARSRDSSAVAARARARLALPGQRASLDGEWMRVGDGFSAAFDPRLAAPQSSLRLGGDLKLTSTAYVGLHHERQHFDQYAVERRAMRLEAGQQLLGRTVKQQVDYAADVQGSGAAPSTGTLAAKATVGLDSRSEIWVEGTHALQRPGEAATTPRPEQVGFGASYRLLEHLRAEAVQRRYWYPNDSAAISTTSLRLKATGFLGGEAWGGVDRASEARASHAAVLGWNQRVALGRGWTTYSLFERRVGLARAPLADPTRALPFVQPELDRWSVGTGLEWLPGSDQARLAIRGEMHDGVERRGQRVELSGDVPLGASMALLTLHDWSQYRRMVGGLTPGLGDLSRADRSLMGFALRPVGWDGVNALAKLEWRRSLNPLTGLGASTGEDTRLIGATDVIWALARGTTLSTRYALRWSTQTPVAGSPVRAHAQFVGTRADRALRGPLTLRLDGRLLDERTTGTTTWNASPSLLFHPDARIELEGGYRFGDLVDRDFSANGRNGLFAAMSLRFTERAFTGPGAFWRERLAREP